MLGGHALFRIEVRVIMVRIESGREIESVPDLFACARLDR